MRIPSLVVVLAIAASSCSSSTPSNTPCQPTHIVRDGEPLPDCTFEKMGSGGTVSLAKLKGKPLILNFWTSWCPSCVREMPAVERVYVAFAGRVAVVGMNGLGVLRESKANAIRYARERGVTYPNGYDEGGRLYSHFFGAIGARPVYPLTLFVDEDGVIRKTAFGEQSEGDLRATIAALFGIR